MVRALVLAVLTGGLLATPPGGVVAQPPAGKKADKSSKSDKLARTQDARLVEKVARAFPTTDLVTQLDERGNKALTVADFVSILQTSRITYEKDLTTTPFNEVLGDLANRYKLPVVVNKTVIEGANNLAEAKADNLAAQRLEGVLLGTFLDVYLRGVTVPNLTYLVRADHIEITTRQAAQKEAGLLEAVDEAKTTGDPADLARAKARLNLPLVCVAVKEKPLAAVLADLSRVYGLNIVVESGVREQTKLALTETLLNVPADTALELLAGQAGLSVVRKGNTYRVTAGGMGAQ